jgi:hypothetical protein
MIEGSGSATTGDKTYPDQHLRKKSDLDPKHSALITEHIVWSVRCIPYLDR